MRAARLIPKLRTLAIALAIGATWLAAGNRLKFDRAPPKPSPPAPCLVFEDGGLRPLDRTDNPETCGARLEVLYLQDGQPVRGAYGPLRLFADADGIDAASLHGPRQKLVSPFMRQVIDREIERLIDAQRQKGMISLTLPPPSGA